MKFTVSFEQSGFLKNMYQIKKVYLQQSAKSLKTEFLFNIGFNWKL